MHHCHPTHAVDALDAMDAMDPADIVRALGHCDTSDLARALAAADDPALARLADALITAAGHRADYPRQDVIAEADALLYEVLRWPIADTSPGWEHNITADVNQTCGALFGPVFDRYNYVCIFSTEATAYNGIPEHKLERGSYLLSVMCSLNMNLREGVVEIWAENK